MRTLITGGNGFLGSALALRLTARGDFVRCLLRPKSDRSSLESLVFDTAEGDVENPESLVAAVENIDTVFHLAGIRRAPAREDFIRVNAEGTRNVCEAMVKTGRRMRLVLCGSLAASGPSSPTRPRTEEDRFQPEEWYGQSKAEAENIAFSYGDRLDVTCARPARILGPGDKENLVFFKLVQRRLKLVLGGGPRPLSLVDVDDVVSLLLLLADSPHAVGQAFFASSHEQITFEDMQDVVAASLGIVPRTLFIPPWFLKGLAATADGISLLSGRNLPLNRKLARQLLAPAWTCSIAKAERLLGYKPTHPLIDSIKRSAAWYQQRGWI